MHIISQIASFAALKNTFTKNQFNYSTVFCFLSTFYNVNISLFYVIDVS